MKSYNTRRRGTSIAAAALSFALVAPFAQPIAAPNLAAHAAAAEKDAFADKPDAAWLGDRDAEWNKNAQGTGWTPAPAHQNDWRHVYWVPGDKLGATQPEIRPDGSYNVDAIASGQVKSILDLQDFAGAGYDVISGRAVVVTPRFGGQLQTTYSGYEPLSNEIPVYMQWMDRDGAISPVYSATTNNSFGNGRYAFAVPQWIDGLGRKHRFMGQTGQKYRVWVEPTNDPETGNELMPLRTAPGMVPHAFGRGSTEGLGEFNGQWGTNGNIQHTGVFMYERAHKQGEADNNYMKAAGPAATLSDENRDPNAKLIYDDLGPRKNAGAHYDDTYYRTVAGKVWIENGNERQLFTAASPAFNKSPEESGIKARVFATALTDKGADAYDEFIENVDVFEKSDKTKQWIANNPDLVAGTVYGEPDAEGEYTLRFPDDVFGNEYNVFTADKFQQHLYMWVEIQYSDGNWIVEPSLSTFTQPVFQDPRNNNQWNPTPVSSVNNAASAKHRYSRLSNVNMALVQSNDVTLDITNFNNTNHYAERGQTATVEVKGDLPVGARLQWRDGRGNVKKECEITDPAELKGCEKFDVPMDAADGSFYYAAINNGYNDIAIDSFLVRVLGPLWSDTRATPNRDTVTLSLIHI